MLEITIELWNTEITNVVGKSVEGGTVYYWYNKETKKWYLGDEWSRKCTFGPSSAIYTWHNTDTKKWYLGDDWSQKCNFSPPSAMNCGSKYYINKLYKNTTKVT